MFLVEPAVSGVGSPPRVRSRHRYCFCGLRRPGITSACAEQTTGMTTRKSWAWDHLRVCGADLHSMAQVGFSLGSPPRVRSRLGEVGEVVATTGITSACAEQTNTVRGRQPADRDHLRVCGADFVVCDSLEVLFGSPPRVRSRPLMPSGDDVTGGITSACAEQTAIKEVMPV